ncbi:MAG: transglycosylase SLT domain-containing protein [Alphaproteobacteria bacterium]|nr:transglycosylase SLT domain-containing protein [Alphaproteobacteria bacterium]
MRTKLAISLAAAAVSLGLMASGAQAAAKHHVRHHKHHRVHRHGKAHFPQVSQATRNSVVAMIKAQAPHYGVPTWFALKIAKVESGYNPMVTGGEGEIGVFQMKCQTARGIGYSGACSGLYNPATNVRYGLKYLSMAVHSSHGNLRLAASKHNGGLGTNHIVRSYVAMVF